MKTTMSQGETVTPGEWEAFRFDECQTVIRAKRENKRHPLICTVSVGEGRPDGDANARLIAAAPDLLSACERALAAMKAEQVSQAKRGESVLVQIGIAMQECDKAIDRATTQKEGAK